MTKFEKSTVSEAGDGEATPGSFAITVVFDLMEGAFPEFCRLVNQNAASSVELEAGCLRFDVLTPFDDERGMVLLYEIYTDREAFEQHLLTDHYLSFDRSVSSMVRAKRVNRYKVAANAK